MRGCVHGSVREEFWAKVGKEPASFPPTMARMGPRTMDQEGSQQKARKWLIVKPWIKLYLKVNI